jgi:predicted HAD superfamily Cof-like phosphohydrolase
MEAKKVKQFMHLAGQELNQKHSIANPQRRKLAAQLLLSETLEYVIKGLGVTPIVNGVKISDANALEYEIAKDTDQLEMLDGLSDVAYTMYWNALAFGLKLEEAFDLVCDNNLEKFVKMSNWQESARPLEKEEWNCKQSITWPVEVKTVEVIEVDGMFFAVGKDIHGKVRKPSSYKQVELDGLL